MLKSPFYTNPGGIFPVIQERHTRYANVKCLDILSHLWTAYGVLQDFEVQENDVRMKQPITAKTLFTKFVEHIKTAVDAVETPSS